MHFFALRIDRALGCDGQLSLCHGSKVKQAEVRRGGTGKMASWVKCLYRRHEDLSSVPRNPHKARHGTAGLQEVETGHVGASEPASLEHSIASRKRAVSKEMEGCCPLTFTRMSWYMCTYTCTQHTHHHPTQRASFQVPQCERTGENAMWWESGQLPVRPHSPSLPCMLVGGGLLNTCLLSASTCP